MRSFLKRRVADVTTTPEDPPRFRALEREGRNVFRDMTYLETLSDQQKKSYPTLKPLKLDLSPQQFFELVQAGALETSNWEISAVEAQRFQLEAVATSPVLRFKSDIVIQVRPEEGTSSSVHLRVKSRSLLAETRVSVRMIDRFLRRLQSKTT